MSPFLCSRRAPSTFCQSPNSRAVHGEFGNMQFAQEENKRRKEHRATSPSRRHQIQIYHASLRKPQEIHFEQKWFSNFLCRLTSFPGHTVFKMLTTQPDMPLSASRIDLSSYCSAFYCIPHVLCCHIRHVFFLMKNVQFWLISCIQRVLLGNTSYLQYPAVAGTLSKLCWTCVRCLPSNVGSNSYK